MATAILQPIHLHARNYNTPNYSCVANTNNTSRNLYHHSPISVYQCRHDLPQEEKNVEFKSTTRGLIYTPFYYPSCPFLFFSISEEAASI
ncbi:hypothetical protein B0T26DRAFT_683416 [Lasiosphaeria miniovina]|uniref:Uncharacterized protein n=1 Tax=Lasiosphaeria miniovina TaxID=1954250 RepID=A0AA40EAZ5_9PEZI|nr:uncharacterized protein B0T26DRAFT_683416 [Lasiosphaeria miniovina]KAK0733295.1 hypothetical protein B0T26DRAFT_683416 [Lasiosphaeria miniovina]